MDIAPFTSHSADILDPFCSLEELRRITVPAKLMQDCLKKPTTFPYLKGMFVRVRFSKGYSLLFIDNVVEGETPYEFQKDDYITYLRCSGKDGSSLIKLSVLSNSEPTMEEYEAAERARILPFNDTARKLRDIWETEVMGRPNDYHVMQDMLQLRERTLEKAKKPASVGNIVAEKVYIERMLNIDWEPEIAEKFRERLAEISSLSDKLVEERLKTVNELIEKTQSNKRANRRVRKVQEKEDGKDRREGSFWELCEGSQESQDVQQTQVLDQAEEYASQKPRKTNVLRQIHAAMGPSLAESIRQVFQ